jgi:hypothetical protein
MTAAAGLLNRCRALGIDLVAGPGGALLWEADADPPAELLRDLAEHKPEVLAALGPPAEPRPGSADSPAWTADDLALVARLIEADLGSPARLALHDPWPMCPGCVWCQRAGRTTREPGQEG